MSSAQYLMDLVEERRKIKVHLKKLKLATDNKKEELKKINDLLAKVMKENELEEISTTQEIIVYTKRTTTKPHKKDEFKKYLDSYFKDFSMPGIADNLRAYLDKKRRIVEDYVIKEKKLPKKKK